MILLWMIFSIILDDVWSNVIGRNPSGSSRSLFFFGTDLMLPSPHLFGHIRRDHISRVIWNRMGAISRWSVLKSEGGIESGPGALLFFIFCNSCVISSRSGSLLSIEVYGLLIVLLWPLFCMMSSNFLFIFSSHSPSNSNSSFFSFVLLWCFFKISNLVLRS